MKKVIAGFLVLGLLVGCAPQAEESGVLPTLAQLPSETPIPPNAVQSERATLPATFTLTPTLTITPSATITDTVTFTPSATITDTPSPTVTEAPTIPPEERPLTGLLDLAIRTTLLPSDFRVPNYQGIEVTPPTRAPDEPLTTATPTSAVGSAPVCTYYPAGGFGSIYVANPALAAQLGCAAGNPPDVTSLPAAWQPFQNGVMVWVNGDIYALYNNGTYNYIPDTFNEGVDPQTSAETAPTGLVVPMRGFLKAWTNTATARAVLGWGTAAEQGAVAVVLRFQNGLMIHIPARGDVLILVGGNRDGTWQSVLGGF